MSEVNEERERGPQNSQKIENADRIDSRTVKEVLENPLQTSLNVFDLSNAADIMVNSVLQRVTLNLAAPCSEVSQNRTISPFPSGLASEPKR